MAQGVILVSSESQTLLPVHFGTGSHLSLAVYLPRLPIYSTVKLTALSANPIGI